ncbi:MAG: serine/threonine-protein kinase, partial [Nocardioides sp.]
MKGVELVLSSAIWTVGDQLAEGGFGQVYELIGDQHSPAAVAKFVPKAPGADRELLFVELSEARNVVPIIDSGDHGDHWVLVMPRADKSLRTYLDESSEVLAFEDASSVLLDIATALIDLNERGVVHRDLKPENILLLNNTWCLADFGISRYAESSTAPDTLKWALTAPYAAPERWRTERATNAADIYALGVMGFEILQGYLPFSGPTMEDYRDQHLHDEVPTMNGVPTALATVLQECLFKAPEARPTPGNLLERLNRQLSTPPTGGLAALQAANQIEVRNRAENGRRASIAASEATRRKERVAVAKDIYVRITSALREGIMLAAPVATLTLADTGHPPRNLGWSIELGQAKLIVTDCLTKSASWNGWDEPAFSLDAWGSIMLQIPRTQYGYAGREHSLWFGDIQEAGHSAWYETAFMHSALSGKRSSSAAPFEL